MVVGVVVVVVVVVFGLLTPTKIMGTGPAALRLALRRVRLSNVFRLNILLRDQNSFPLINLEVADAEISCDSF